MPLGVWSAWVRRFLVGLLLFGAAQVQAQQQLVVNGVPVAGLTTEVVPGAAYVPVAAYARALGADYRVDPQAGVLLVFGGRILTLQSFGTPAEAAEATTALVRDGRRLPSSGAVQVAGTVYLPVKSVSAALGGETAYLAEAGTVAVVFPRPQLLAAEPPGVWGSFERFVLSFSAPVSFGRYFEPSLNVVRFRFPRAELGSEALAARRFSGSRFSHAAFVPGGEFLDFYLTLLPGSSYSVFSEADGDGERVVIDVFREAGTRSSAAQVPRIVLDAGPGTVALAHSLEQVLGDRGAEVELVTPQAATAAHGVFGAPFVLALRRAPLAPGRFGVYYLAPGAPLLDAPVRRAAPDAALSEAGRARLVALTPALERGEELARDLAEGLAASTPLTLTSLLEAPLLELSGAAGRGVLLELSAADLRAGSLSNTLSAPLAEALLPLLGPP